MGTISGTRPGLLLQTFGIPAIHGSQADGDMPLSEIALRLGYSEQSVFSRAFRSWTGVAPSVYRKDLGLCA